MGGREIDDVIRSCYTESRRLLPLRDGDDTIWLIFEKLKRLCMLHCRSITQLNVSKTHLFLYCKYVIFSYATIKYYLRDHCFIKNNL